jgi:hypothetical protein
MNSGALETQTRKLAITSKAPRSSAASNRNDGFDFFMVCGSGDFALSSGFGVVAVVDSCPPARVGHWASRRVQIVEIFYRVILDGGGLRDTGIGNEDVQVVTDNRANLLRKRGSALPNR